MDGLDLLKKHWDKDSNFPKINKEEIRSMLHKSSSSIVKWIFIICCLEFLLGISSYFIFPSDPEKFLFLDIIYWSLDIFIYSVILYFIYTFFKLLRNINSSNSTKTLLENIIKVRENADRYIKFNLLYINLIFVIVFLTTLIDEYIESHSWGMVIFVFFLAGVFLVLFALLFRYLIKLYYKLIYGILLKKLNKNYEELVALEKEE